MSMIELQPGNLNDVSLVEGRGNKLMVLRKPQPRINIAKTMVQVRDECLQEGFLDNSSNQVRIRPLADQVTLAQRLKQVGLPTPATSLNSPWEQLVDYIPHTDKLYDLWLNQDPRAAFATPKVLEAVMRAHEADLILGDRTGKNDLVTQAADIMLIDFDIQLSGSEAREFELTNLIYRLSRAAHRGSLRQLPVLGEICEDILSGHQIRVLYNRDTLLRYLDQFTQLSSDEGMTKLHGMTPIIQPEYSAELFTFLTDVLKSNPQK